MHVITFSSELSATSEVAASAVGVSSLKNEQLQEEPSVEQKFVKSAESELVRPCRDITRVVSEIFSVSRSANSTTKESAVSTGEGIASKPSGPRRLGFVLRQELRIRTEKKMGKIDIITYQ